MSRRDTIAEHYREDIDQWKGESGEVVVGVRINSRGESCSYCQALLGEHSLEHAPEFPPRECEDEYGCSSWWEPVLSDEVVGSGDD
ncbi:MAG: hypothetical protein GC151_07705 [Betaproteobacteria bacterium]|nr:hypothetical protein [Betaproteobacteria bacterium]